LTIAVEADSGQDDVRFRHVSAADLGRLGSRRLRIRHKRRREGPLAVARAILAGHSRARTQRGWLEDVEQHPKLLLRRGDAQANILALADALAAFADWETMLTRPTWAVLMERTGFSRSTLAAHLSWMRSVGLLGLVAGGTTPEFSPGILRGQADEHEQNEAAVYVLCAPAHLRLVALPHPDDVGAEFVDDERDQDLEEPVPPALMSGVPGDRSPVDESRTPSPSRREVIPPAREREIRNLQDPELKRPVPAWLAPERPATMAERAAAALEARRTLPVLARISTAYVAALLREWHLAGWTLSDVLTALQRTPEGMTWRNSDDVRHVPGWLKHRLAAWRSDPLDSTSPPGRSPGARAEAAAVHTRAAARAKAERAAASAESLAASAPVDVQQWAAAARAALRARRDQEPTG
jgi:hypothetical protein